MDPNPPTHGVRASKRARTGAGGEEDEEPVPIAAGFEAPIFGARVVGQVTTLGVQRSCGVSLTSLAPRTGFPLNCRTPPLLGANEHHTDGHQESRIFFLIFSLVIEKNLNKTTLSIEKKIRTAWSAVRWSVRG